MTLQSTEYHKEDYQHQLNPIALADVRHVALTLELKTTSSLLYFVTVSVE